MPFIRLNLLIVIMLMTTNAFGLGLQNGHLALQLGAFNASLGKTQFIPIQDLIGNRYVANKHHDTAGLLGIGYYVDAYQHQPVILSYGVNAFYLNNAEVSGNVIQELLFNNLKYSYTVSYIPIYAILKATVHDHTEKYGITFDVGIGPDFITTEQYGEQSLDGGITIPDHAFNGTQKKSFSATVGIGIKMNNVFKTIPLECGYRFFSLGQGILKPRTNQILSSLKTGNSTANALVCSVSF